MQLDEILPAPLDRPRRRAPVVEHAPSLKRKHRDTFAVGVALSAVAHGLLFVGTTALRARASHTDNELTPPARRAALMVALSTLPQSRRNNVAKPSPSDPAAPRPRWRSSRHRMSARWSPPPAAETPDPAESPAPSLAYSAQAQESTLAATVALPVAVGNGDGTGSPGDGQAKGASSTNCCGRGTSTGAPATAETSKVPARPLQNPRPIYPRRARLMGWEGSVLLRILVDAQGNPAEVTVVASSGQSVLDQSAVEAVRRWKFSPALEAGRPVAMAHEVRIHFRLDDAHA